MISLKNKTILITGASSGIGKASAFICHELGAHVILTSRREDELKEICNQLKDNSSYVVGDLTQENEIEILVASISNLDGIVHCAGIVKPVPIKFIKKKHITEMFDVNFSSAVLLSSNLLSQKKINSNASVVFVSSVSVNHPYTGGALYISSKGALEAFNKAFALEGSSKKIRSNIVAPALVKTNIWDQITESFTEEDIQKIENQYPLGLGEADDVAKTIAFLLSDMSKWITGTTITMDGGLLLNSTK